MSPPAPDELAELRLRLARQDALLAFLYIHLELGFLLEAAATGKGEVLEFLRQGDLLNAIKAHRAGYLPKNRQVSGAGDPPTLSET
jgi:hypothetical protein